MLIYIQGIKFFINNYGIIYLSIEGIIIVQ